MWIPLTLLAAFMQNVRSAAQQRLKSGAEGAGTLAATFARFGFALPFAALFLALSIGFGGAPGDRAPGAAFWAWTASAAAAQIGATWALLRSFDHANFAVGAAFSKTEPLLAAVFGAALLGETPPALAAIGLGIGVIGVAGLSLAPAAAEGLRTGSLTALSCKALFWGLLAAALFGYSGVGFRGASLSLGEGAAAPRAALTLLAALTLQAGALGLWLRLRQPTAWRALRETWRIGLLAGAAGAAASACWFTAMTLEPAAHVKALGQVELVFAAAASALYFHQPPTRPQIAAAGLIGLGAALLLLGTARG